MNYTNMSLEVMPHGQHYFVVFVVRHSFYFDYYLFG